jgi:hypothetical protein
VTDWTVDTLLAHFTAILVERDRRFDERLLAAAAATSKAEAATDHRFESVNEFRGTLTDQATLFATRVEVASQLSRSNDRLLSLGDRVTALEATQTGGAQAVTQHRNAALYAIAAAGHLDDPRRSAHLMGDAT